MSLTLGNIPVLYPAYTDDLVLTADESTADEDFYYKFKIYFDGSLIDTFDYLADPNDHDAAINLSPILSSQFTSQTPIITGSSVFNAQDDTIIPYYVVVESYNENDTQVDSGQTATSYVFNGVVNAEDEFSMSDYVFQTGGTANFLTHWHTLREIELDSKAHISTIIGDYGDITSDFGGVNVTRYQDDNTMSAVTFNNSNNTDKKIMVIDVSPDQINNQHTDFINSNTKYYTVSEKDNKTKQVMRINIAAEKKNKNPYNFIYINPLGGIDFFTATKAAAEDFSVGKRVLDHFFEQKVYNTDVEQEVNVMTQFLSIDQGKGLKSLFYSPDVKLHKDDRTNSVRITNSSFTVKNKYPKDSFVQYEFSYQYNYKHHVQRF